MKVLVFTWIVLMSVVATAGKPGSDVSTTIATCDEAFIDHGLIITITASSLEGTMLATVPQVTFATTDLVGTFEIREIGFVKESPTSRFYQGQGIRIEVDTTPYNNGENIFAGKVHMILEGKAHGADLFCRY